MTSVSSASLPTCSCGQHILWQADRTGFLTTLSRTLPKTAQWGATVSYQLLRTVSGSVSAGQETSPWPSTKGAGILESMCSEQSCSWTGLSSRGLVSFSPPRGGGGPEGERTPEPVGRPFVSLRAWLSKNGLLMKALFHFTGDRECIRSLGRTGPSPSSHEYQC